MGSASADPAEPGIAVLSGLAGFADRLAQEGLATTFRWTGAPATPHETTLLLRGFTPNDATLAGHIVQLRGRLDPGAAWLVAVPRQAFSPHDQEPRVETLIRRNPAGVAYNEAVSTHRDAPRVTTGVALVDRSTGGTLASFGLTGA